MPTEAVRSIQRHPAVQRARRPRGILAAITLGVVLAACGKDATGPAGNIVRPPVTPPVDTTPPPAGVAGLSAVGLGRVSTRFTGEVTVRGNVAYTSTWSRRVGNLSGNVIFVWDVSGNTPVVRDSVFIEGVTTTGDVQVSDDGALLVVATEPTGLLVTYSLADPLKPRLLSRFTTPNLSAGVHTAQVSRVNGRLYAFCSIDPRSGVRAKLVVVDLGDPAAPREVFAREMGEPFVHDVFVRDGYLFTALWDTGLTIWDIGGAGRGGSPSAPVPLGTVRTVNGSVHNVWWYHDPATGQKKYAFVGEEVASGISIGNSSAGDIHVVDVSDMTAPREVAFYNVPGAGAHNFSMDESRGVLYAAFYNGGVRALDVRGDLAACTAAQRTPDGRCNLRLMGRELARGLADASELSRFSPGTGGVYVWGVEYSGGHLYASDMLGGLWKLTGVSR
jgi:hypothetical protein